jgi:23S rRNA (guanosine2251-2'-O)-methyltransferase
MKDEKEEKDELIFGKHAVLSFLEQGAVQFSKTRVNKIFIAEGLRFDTILASIHSLASRQKIPIQKCDKKKLDKLVGFDNKHQGIVAAISMHEIWPMADFLSKLSSDREESIKNGVPDNYTVAILDGIEDPHNLGAIIRAGEAAGVKAVFISQHRSVGITGAVARTSAGALANLPVVRVTNLVQTIEALKKLGFWMVGLDHDASQIYTDIDLPETLAIIIGSEGKGISTLVRKHCDFLVSIPMLGKTQSLNASVAAGIIFYEAVRQRNSKPHNSGKRY